jgi:hypothetical protein
MKTFECFWGDGYRDSENKSILAYHDEEFFTEDRGYSELVITWVKGLEVNDHIDLEDLSGTHWIRRIN